IDPQIGRADGIGFLGHEMSALLEPRSRTRERESDQQSKQAEHGGFRGPGALGQSLGIACESSRSNATTNLATYEHGEEHDRNGQPGFQHDVILDDFLGIADSHVAYLVCGNTTRASCTNSERTLS